MIDFEFSRFLNFLGLNIKLSPWIYKITRLEKTNSGKNHLYSIPAEVPGVALGIFDNNQILKKNDFFIFKNNLIFFNLIFFKLEFFVFVTPWVLMEKKYSPFEPAV